MTVGGDALRTNLTQTTFPGRMMFMRWNLVISGTSYASAVCDGTNLCAPEIFAGGVYESTDQGTTWTLNTEGIVASFWQAGCASSAGYLVGHWEVFATL